MRRGQTNPAEIDEPLLEKVAALSAGSQRWLKTVLHAITTIETTEERAERRPRPAARPRRAAPPPPKLDELLSGEADVAEQAEAHPELADDLKGIAEIADLLRELGRRRRALGEDILRESEPEEESPESPDDGSAA